MQGTAYKALVAGILGLSLPALRAERGVLKVCGDQAKSAAKVKLRAELGMVEIMQQTTWLSGYETDAADAPIYTSIIDFQDLDGDGYVGYLISTSYRDPLCDVRKIEKLPL